MNAEPTVLLQGNIASAQGAHAAGCRFFAGYPITPSSEIMSAMADLLKKDGTFIQMEDEIASICAAIGASLAGVKSMTATSGPGFSLMQEAMGYAYFAEIPLVVIDVQRAGPATGQATRPAQGDMMQIRYGSHGDMFPIALCPASVQEMFDLTVRAFNLAEQYRVPVVVAADEVIAHARETVRIPAKVQVHHRDRSQDEPPFGSPVEGEVPPLPAFGEGARLLVTGSTHDARGFRRVDDGECHETLVRRLKSKIELKESELVELESLCLDDAEVVFFSFGISARSARAAVNHLRVSGIKAGLLRTRTYWPFPKVAFSALPASVRHIVVPELNCGMTAELVKSCTRLPVHSITQVNGEAILPSRLIDAAKELL